MDAKQQQIENARRVLYTVDPSSGTIIGKSQLYQIYEKNAADYAKAKSDYAMAYSKARFDPAALQAWPLTAKTYQQTVDSAWDDWVNEGKLKIESALAVLNTYEHSTKTQLTQQQ